MTAGSWLALAIVAAAPAFADDRLVANRVYFTTTLGTLQGFDAATHASLGWVRLPSRPWALAIGRRTEIACVGDCDGRVGVDELVGATRAALLGAAPTCDALDPGDDATVSIDDLMAAVDNALDGCP